MNDEIKKVCTKKLEMTALQIMGLSALGGMYISLGFLGYFKASLMGEYGHFIGACIFPIGLIGILMCGGELFTGNMMYIPFVIRNERHSIQQLLINQILVLTFNFNGAFITAFLFGYLGGFTNNDQIVSIAMNKIDTPFFSSFLSAVGCNILVCFGVWMFLKGDSITSKIIGMWFPVMLFVLIGFQHVVANMFIIPAALLYDPWTVTWTHYFQNFVPVFLGNIVGGVGFGWWQSRISAPSHNS
jgi:formate/nitrite transporter